MYYKDCYIRKMLLSLLRDVEDEVRVAGRRVDCKKELLEGCDDGGSAGLAQ